MLPKKRRIKREEFGPILRVGKSASSPFLNLKYIAVPDLNISSFAVVVSKAVAKKAVDRNLFKRRVYSIVQEMEKKIKSGYRCVFFVKKEAMSLSYTDLKQAVLAVFSRTVLFEK